MKRITRVCQVILCAVLITVILGACNTKQMTVSADYLDITPIGYGEITVIETDDNQIIIAAPNTVMDIRINLHKFFTQYPEFIGKNFYFTRDDVKKGDNTYIKGLAWVEYDNDGIRRYKQLGKHEDTEIQPKTRGQIANLPDHEGKARMYILADGSHILYLDPSPESNITENTTVTFRLHGHHGRVAMLQIQLKFV